MNTLKGIFGRIIARPEIYVGGGDIIAIGHYLDGYYAAKGDDYAEDVKDYREFEAFIRKRYNDLNHRWFRIIQYNSLSNKEALQELKELINEYCK